jgi:quinol monooxygenase YgiN
MFNGTGVTEAQYRQVFDRVAPNGQLHPGNLYHAAGPTENGWCVIEVWDSHESLEQFQQEKLGAALQEANITGEITVFELSNEVKP